MASMIKCPGCGLEFPLEEALNDELKDILEKQKNDFRRQMTEYKNKKDAELKEKESAFQKQQENLEKNYNEKLQEALQQDRLKLKAELITSLKAEYANEMTILQNRANEHEEKLQTARKKELELMQEAENLRRKDSERDLEIKKMLLQENEKVRQQCKDDEMKRIQEREAEHKLKEKEFEKQLSDQKKLVEEMQRKSEQGSMQLQGEVQELLLEEILKTSFPFDLIAEVPKGNRGADCIQTVRNNFGLEAGKIIYESKRTKEFSAEWIEKLKVDMRTLGADIAVIVTKAFPKDMAHFGEKDGVYICSFTEVNGVALLLRNALLKIAEARKSSENKGDKMVMLYDYLTSNEFGEQWKAIREGFMLLKMGIQKERIAMEKIWKMREKQLDKVLLNAAYIKGSVEGIAGAEAINLNLTDEDDLPLLED